MPLAINHINMFWLLKEVLQTHNSYSICHSSIILRFICIEIFHLRTQLTIIQISDCRRHYCTDLDSKRMVMTYLFVIKLQYFICFVNHECEEWVWLIHCCITMPSIFEGMFESDVSAFVATMFQFWVQFTYLTSKIQSSMI